MVFELDKGVFDSGYAWTVSTVHQVSNLLSMEGVFSHSAQLSE